jgi:polyhydroxyalkanoate synthase
MSVDFSPLNVLRHLVQVGQNVSLWMTAINAQDGTDSDLKRIQQEWLECHGKLWQAMISNQIPEMGLAEHLPNLNDRRFAAGAWSESPVYDYVRRAYLINSEFIFRVADELPVHDEKARLRLRFYAKQFSDALSPSNFAATNPEFIKRTIESKGGNIQAGILNLLADLERGHIATNDEHAFEVGKSVAATPGAVVYENELIQLIQYSPSNAKVYQRPLLIVPPCINKFYILDLQAENSFVRFTVSQGHTVFLISWRNVSKAEGRLTWDDYVERGVLKALHTVSEISGVRQPNVLGFCVGGTLLCSALAVAEARGDKLVKSITLLTTLLDFTEAGEISCLVDQTSVSQHEETIGKGGIFPGHYFSSVFSALRPNELIWSYVVNGYLNGQKPAPFDLLFWNSDSTNLPGPFLAWYLRNMYLENNLCVPDRLVVCNALINLKRIKVPAFVLAAREDHIVPWQGAFRSMQCLGGETTFVLGASGHIAGVINPANSKKRNYWTGNSGFASASDWFSMATEVHGSWWPEWSRWLKNFGGKFIASVPELGNEIYKPIEAAPGRYVREKA